MNTRLYNFKVHQSLQTYLSQIATQNHSGDVGIIDYFSESNIFMSRKEISYPILGYKLDQV